MFGRTGDEHAQSRSVGALTPYGGLYSMPQVLTECPVSGGLVPTSVDAERLDDLPPDNVLLACPDCGADHEWTPSEAVMVSYAG